MNPDRRVRRHFSAGLALPEMVASRACLREAIFSPIWHIFPNFWNNA